MLQTSVEMVNPGGTGSLARDISARPAPLPPSTSFILPSPSADPPPNEYTYFFILLSYVLVTISEKSAMVENSASSVCNRVSRFCRILASGALTSTLSKNRSTFGRRDAVEDEFFELCVAAQQFAEGQPQFPFDQNLDDALRRAPQCERIARARRNQADAEAAAQRIQLVGERNQLSSRVAWDGIFHAGG